MDKKRADEFPSEQAAKRIVVTLQRPDPLAVLTGLLKVVPDAWIQEDCACSVAALRLTCTQLRRGWDQRWQAAHSSWASHGAFPELNPFPYRQTRYLGARFLQPVDRRAVVESIEATNRFQIDEFVAKSCFAIEVDAIAMLAKYHAAHHNKFKLSVGAVRRLVTVALKHDSPSALAVVLTSAVLLRGKRVALPACSRFAQRAFPYACMEYLLSVSEAQRAARDGLSAQDCTHVEGRWHEHTLRLLPFGLPTLCHHKRPLLTQGNQYTTKSTIGDWNLEGLCQWLVSACPPVQYLAVVDFVLRLVGLPLDGLPPEPCYRGAALLFWLLERAPAQLIDQLRQPKHELPRGADLLTRPHVAALLQRSVASYLWRSDKLGNAKHLNMVRWFLAAHPCKFVPTRWELQLILTDPLLSDADKALRIYKSALLDAPPSKELTAAIPISTLVRYSASTSHHAEYLLALCDSCELSSEGLLDVLAEVDALCRKRVKRRAAIAWINTREANQSPFALRMLRELLPLRATRVDHDRLWRVLEFLSEF